MTRMKSETPNPKSEMKRPGWAAASIARAGRPWNADRAIRESPERAAVGGTAHGTSCRGTRRRATRHGSVWGLAQRCRPLAALQNLLSTNAIPWLIAVALLLIAGNTFAIEAKEIKSAADRAGNWLIEQFDLKEKVFGKGPEAKDVATVAMCVTALCNHPRDYKEASGPFISEPVKYILSQINEDGTVKGGKAEEYFWLVAALKATKNDRYTSVIEKLLAARCKLPSDDVHQEAEVAELRWEIGCIRSYFNLVSDHLKEAQASGLKVGYEQQKITWTIGDSDAFLLKVQQKDGSFDADVRKSAVALEKLNESYRNVKK